MDLQVSEGFKAEVGICVSHLNIMQTPIQYSEPRTVLLVEYESVHRIFYKIVCAPSENSDQPAHPDILNRIFAVRLRKLGISATCRAQSNDSLPKLI